MLWPPSSILAHLTPPWRTAASCFVQVQQEDITICEDVQKNLGARSINFVGRYAPEFEGPAYQFHQLLAQHLRAHQVLQA